MKRIFSLMLIAFMALAFSACNSCTQEKSKPAPVTDYPVPTVAEFDSVLSSNYATVKDSCPGVDVKFYESQIVFSGNCGEDSLRIVSLMNVFQADSMCFQFIYRLDTTAIVKTNDYWLEDVAININNIISLDSALIQLHKADIMKPLSPAVTLRNPLGPTLTTPGYIFGSRKTFFVKVDAITGKVAPF